MSTSGGRQMFVTVEHRSVGRYAALLADGTPAPDERINGTYPQPGHAGCSCGAISQVQLSSKGRRRAWHTRHREEAGAAPWSDAARAADSKWPAIFDAEVREMLHAEAVWSPASRNVWTARTSRDGFMAHACVIETADGTGDSWIGHVIGDNVSVGFAERLHFRMLDALADRIRPAWEVGCRACGEAWPCPVREIAAHPQAERRSDALDHVPYGVVKHG